MINVYIDESGNLGRAGKYFVLAAVVFDTKQGTTRAKRIIKREQLLIAKERKLSRIEEIKSYQLKFSQRQRILNKMIAKPDMDIFYLVIYKPSTSLLNHHTTQNLIYNYFAKLLTDMIFAHYDDDYNVVFDQRTTCVKSMNSLTDYIKINAYTRHKHFERDIQVMQRDSKTLYNLQTADLIVGTVYQAYTKHKRHFLDMLAPRIVQFDEFPRGTFRGSFKEIDNS